VNGHLAAAAQERAELLFNDAQAVAFQWQPQSGGEVDVYVAAAADSGWVTRGRVLADTDGLPSDATGPVISADGRAVYLTVVQYEPTGGPTETGCWKSRPGNGQPRVLFELRYQPEGGNLVPNGGRCAATPAGNGAFATGYVYRIEISSGEVIRLPFPEGQPYDAAW
jgi:hypothetical protein